MKHFLFLIALLLTANIINASAQQLTPTTRFHQQDSRFRPYDDCFLSGFMQTAANVSANNGFLQIPFVGSPLLVYVGEKDSTQFMAYATGYEYEECRTDVGQYKVNYLRYDVRGELTAHPAYVEQNYTFPDTVADKGFLIDLDHGLSGATCEDMDVVFIDKYTIRAYRRSVQTATDVPELYYVARFSHPFTTWNVRRERVKTENGQMETRCKAAFTFAIQKGETLRVRSAVSAVSSNAALASIPQMPRMPMVDDKRNDRPTKSNAALLAANRANANNGARRTNVRHTSAVASVAHSSKNAPESNNGFDISTRDAELRTAFFAAVEKLKALPECMKATDAVAIIDVAAKYYERPTDMPELTFENADSLLHHTAKKIFEGSGASFTTEQAAFYLLGALGIVPDKGGNTYRIVRPLFNVVNLALPNQRRFMLYVKNNSPRAASIRSATWQGTPMVQPYTFAREKLLRGGILELKMEQKR